MTKQEMQKVGWREKQKEIEFLQIASSAKRALLSCNFILVNHLDRQRKNNYFVCSLVSCYGSLEHI